MAKEFVIKNGLIVNDTHAVTGITNDSGLTYNTARLVTEDAIKRYVENSSYWDLQSTILSPTNTGNTVQLSTLQFNSIGEQYLTETGLNYLNSSNTCTIDSSGTLIEKHFDFLYYSYGRWYEKLTGDEVFVQTLDASDNHNDLTAIQEYCERQFTRMQ